MILKTILAILIILIMVFAAFWIIEEIKYSFKVNKDLNNHNATCYFERGMFKLPLAKICTYNETILVEKK